MTNEQYNKLQIGDRLINLNQMKPTRGVMIPAKTEHKVIGIDNVCDVISTETQDVANVKCAFRRSHALQLLQKL